MYWKRAHLRIFQGSKNGCFPVGRANFFTVVTRANTSLHVKHITKSVSKYEIVRITYMRFYKLNSN